MLGLEILCPTEVKKCLILHIYVGQHKGVIQNNGIDDEQVLENTKRPYNIKIN